MSTIDPSRPIPILSAVKIHFNDIDVEPETAFIVAVTTNLIIYTTSKNRSSYTAIPLTSVFRIDWEV